jgi:hypothetical protein
MLLTWRRSNDKGEGGEGGEGGEEVSLRLAPLLKKCQILIMSHFLFFIFQPTMN